MVAILTALIGILVGYFVREIREALKRIEQAARVLVAREQKKEQQEKKMKFAEPIKWDELDDQEKMDLLNL